MGNKWLSRLRQLWLALQDQLLPAHSPVWGDLVKTINLGGEAVEIEGERWQSYREALATGLSVPGATMAKTAITPIPYTRPGLRAMLNTTVYKPETLELDQTLPNGSYQVYLWILENFKTDWHSFTVSVGGQPVATEVGRLKKCHWARYGPYAVQVDGGHFHLALTTHKPEIDAHLMGLSIVIPPVETQG